MPHLLLVVRQRSCGLGNHMHRHISMGLAKPPELLYLKHEAAPSSNRANT